MSRSQLAGLRHRAGNCFLSSHTPAALRRPLPGREGTLNRTYEILMLLRIRWEVEMWLRIASEVESPRLTSGLLETTNASASAGMVVVAAGGAARRGGRGGGAAQKN